MLLLFLFLNCTYVTFII